MLRFGTTFVCPVTGFSTVETLGAIVVVAVGVAPPV